MEKYRLTRSFRMEIRHYKIFILLYYNYNIVIRNKGIKIFYFYNKYIPEEKLG